MAEPKYGQPDQARSKAGFETDQHGNPIGRLTSLAENDGSSPYNTIYYGEAAPGTASSAAEWAIRKFTYDSNGVMTAMKWADSVRSFTKVWDNRATYAYA